MVGGGPVHLFALPSAPEISAADYKRNLYAQIVDLLYLVNDARNDVFVKSVSRFARKRFARKFYQYSFIFRFQIFHKHSLSCQL